MGSGEGVALLGQFTIHRSPFVPALTSKVSCSPKVTSRDLKPAAAADLGIIRYSPTTDDGQKGDAMSV